MVQALLGSTGTLCFLLAELPEEKEKVKKAADHCRQILNHVNQAVKESENKQVRGQGEHPGLGAGAALHSRQFCCSK